MSDGEKALVDPPWRRACSSARSRRWLRSFEQRASEVHPGGRGIVSIALGISVLASLALCNISVTVLAADKRQGRRINYVAKLNELVRKENSKDLNAGPFYEKILELYVESPVEVSGNDVKRWLGEFSPERRAALQGWVNSNSSALARLRLGT